MYIADPNLGFPYRVYNEIQEFLDDWFSAKCKPIKIFRSGHLWFNAKSFEVVLYEVDRLVEDRRSDEA